MKSLCGMQIMVDRVLLLSLLCSILVRFGEARYLKPDESSLKVSRVYVRSFQQFSLALNRSNYQKQYGKIEIVLIKDITLLDRLPLVRYGANISIISGCRTASGKGRRCGIFGYDYYSIHGTDVNVFESSMKIIDGHCEFYVLGVVFAGFLAPVFRNVPCKIRVERCSFTKSEYNVLYSDIILPSGLRAVGPSVYFIECTFTNILLYYESIIRIDDNRSKLFFYSCQFINNTSPGDFARMDGGVMTISGQGSAYFENVLFKGNQAEDGAAIYSNGTSVTVFSSSFISNDVAVLDYYHASVIFMASPKYSSTSLTLCNVRFTENFVMEGGYGIRTEGRGTIALCNTIIPRISSEKWIPKACPKDCRIPLRKLQ